MSERRELYRAEKMQIMFHRMAYEMLERHPQLAGCCLIGIQPRGVHFGRRMARLLQQLSGRADVPYGELDVTFYRDDFRRSQSPLLPNATRVDFIIEGRQVILLDDVLYTGRTVRAALDAMLAFGRPVGVELAVLVDRSRLRQLPIQADYAGIQVDTLERERVKVSWQENGEDLIYIEN
ncbi:MAG: bifunctional pyr operon transcriptional regulator/uracil phosphoribosyltransferase PyrR [Bacteroidetes bacterium]|jgi:pyrimidine operon attenuation protein/uracil phosphoribosyltransferase|nr:bifunctional pyr operon transcriptional regulator/uracil phosphoribosyltransferase PyrR [Bacteroidota bacterium]